MKGTIRRKRRPPVTHAGLPMIPGRRRQNLSARCGTLTALATPDAGNTGPDKKLGANGHSVNRRAVSAINQAEPVRKTLTRNRQTFPSATGLIKPLGYRNVSRKRNDEAATRRENVRPWRPLPLPCHGLQINMAAKIRKQQGDLPVMTVMDYISIVVFIVLWATYTHLTTGTTLFSRTSLNQAMAERRRDWIYNSLKRDLKMIDTQIMAGLQNGTAFSRLPRSLPSAAALLFWGRQIGSKPCFATCPSCSMPGARPSN